MQRSLIMAITLMALASGSNTCLADASSRLPGEVSDFLLNREACDHFRGEVIDPPDAELKKERNDNIRTYCTGTDAALARLRQKYAKRRDVVQSLRGFEAKIEASPR
ncbi:MAG: hypothetical protein IV110_03475 [Aquabacterium sp.]|uniref:hypothetical protein n=1 Tax=Aquabacterium sp. TaxID=1872578 RepID=UPI001D20D326|nr:hypothetical protein [Aquabacterium sp.]MBT9609083.1 hypothetical protein [Aquabacterium sp.]